MNAERKERRLQSPPLTVGTAVLRAFRIKGHSGLWGAVCPHTWVRTHCYSAECSELVMTPVGTPVRTATVHTPCWPAHHLSPHTWLALHPCFFILFVLRLKCFPLPYKTRLLPFFKQDFFVISPVKSFYFYSFVCGNLYLYTLWAHFPPESRTGNYTNVCVYTVLMAVSRILTHTNYLVT